MRTLNHNRLMVMDNKIAMKMARKMAMKMAIMMMMMETMMREETEKEKETHEIIIMREMKEKGREQMKK